MIQGPKVGTISPLDYAGIYIIGRGEECESTNKTFVNKKVIEDLVELKTGDMIGIGDTVLVFTDQKGVPIKSVEDFQKLRVDQTMRIDLPPAK